eukprot:scaffold20364_cov112-Isochrysis_galbana.AAC.4
MWQHPRRLPGLAHVQLQIRCIEAIAAPNALRRSSRAEEPPTQLVGHFLKHVDFESLHERVKARSSGFEGDIAVFRAHALHD